MAGDADQLVQALEEREVAYFRSEKREDLRGYLVRGGGVDRLEMPAPQQMWQCVIAQVGKALQERVIDAENLRRFFSRFGEATLAEGSGPGES